MGKLSQALSCFRDNESIEFTSVIKAAAGNESSLELHSTKEVPRSTDTEWDSAPTPGCASGWETRAVGFTAGCTSTSSLKSSLMTLMHL